MGGAVRVEELLKTTIFKNTYKNNKAEKVGSAISGFQISQQFETKNSTYLQNLGATAISISGCPDYQLSENIFQENESFESASGGVWLENPGDSESVFSINLNIFH